MQTAHTPIRVNRSWPFLVAPQNRVLEAARRVIARTREAWVRSA